MNGNVRAVETLKQRLESGDDVDLVSESDSCTVASLLKQYLRDLPEGLVDSAVQQALIQHYQGKTPTAGRTSLPRALSVYLFSKMIRCRTGMGFYDHHVMHIYILLAVINTISTVVSKYLGYD